MVQLLSIFDKFQKSEKKSLTKGKRSGKIGKLSGRQIYRRAKKKRAPSLKRPRKKVKKLSKKVLTKAKRCGIITKLSAQKRVANGH